MNTIKGENEWVKMEIHEYYFFIEYKTGTKLDLIAAKKIIEDAVKLADGKVYPAMTDIKNMPSHSKDVRDYFANEGSKNAIANAIIISSSLSSILANIFLTLNKPVIPTRIFTDSKKAAKWLEMFPVTSRKVLI